MSISSFHQNKPTPLFINTPKGRRYVGPGHPVFIIAEMSGNHNMDFHRALKLIDVAIDAGVDAIKMQTYTPDTITIDCDNEYFQVKVNEAWSGQTLYSLYQKAYTPWEWQPKLIDYARSKGMLLFSTPFDETAVDFLEAENTPLYKVASFESSHIPLLRKIGATKKPVILSRGLTSLRDIEIAIQTLTDSGCPGVAVLHCVSSYPAILSQMNLKTIPDIEQRLNVVTGLSDHSLGFVAPVTSVALGASIIEKHYTISRADGGPDSAFSLEAHELKELVQNVRATESSLGQPNYSPDSKENENLLFKRSIFVTQDVKCGETLNLNNIRVIRPGHGLAPMHLDQVLGRPVTKDIQRGTPLDWGVINQLI